MHAPCITCHAPTLVEYGHARHECARCRKTRIISAESRPYAYTMTYVSSQSAACEILPNGGMRFTPDA